MKKYNIKIGDYVVPVNPDGAFNSKAIFYSGKCGRIINTGIVITGVEFTEPFNGSFPICHFYNKVLRPAEFNEILAYKLMGGK